MWGIGYTEAVVVGFTTLPLLAFLYLVVRVARSSKGSALDIEGDQEFLREISRMLESMEGRIDSLETILQDHPARKTKSADNDH